MSALQIPKGIRQRGGSYIADATYRGRRRTGTADTLEDAIILKRELMAELKGERVASLPAREQSAWTIGKAIRVTEQVAWRDSRWGEHASFNANHFAKFVGRDAPLDTIDMTKLDQWVDALAAEGKSDSTINRYLAAVSKVFTTAQERGGAYAKPKFPRRKEAQGRIRFLIPEEDATFLRLFEQWGKDGERDLFVVLIDTGFRMGEALPLMEPEGLRDVDFKTGMITAWETKNGDARSVPMTKRVRAVMERRAGKGGMWQKAPPVSRHSFRQTWDRAKATLGMAKDTQLVPHALRHTCASRLVQRSVPLKVVQEWMGHKSITITMRYAHLAPANLMAAVKALEEE